MALLGKGSSKVTPKVVSKILGAFKRDAAKTIENSSPRVAMKAAPSKPASKAVTPSTPTAVTRSTAPTRTPSVSVQPSTPTVRAWQPVPKAFIEASRPLPSRLAPSSRLAGDAASQAGRAVEAVTPVPVKQLLPEPTPGEVSYKYIPDLAPSTPARLLDEGIVSRAETSIPAATSTTVAPAMSQASGPTAEEAVAAGEAAIAAARRPFLTAARTRNIAGNIAPFVPQVGVSIAEGADINVPGPIKGAANLAAALGGARLGYKALKPLGSPLTRDLIKNLPGNKITKPLRQAKALTTPVGGGLLGGALTYIGGKGLLTGAPKPPAANATEPAVPEVPVLPPLGGTETPAGTMTGMTPEQEVKNAIDNALGNLQSGNGTLEDANTVATGQQNVLDDAVAKAMADLEAAYGGPEEISTAVAAGDPILMQQLAGIDADYQAGLLQIQANYAGALGQVAGYQAQADALMKDVAAQQMAGFAAAAGGLEAMSPGVGLTGSQAAAAGVSDTALGGAGITGAALSRGLAGAASAQAAADRLRLGTDLAGQLATGRLSQADLESALARAAAGEKATARAESATREAEARALAKKQKREDAIRIAELKYQAALDKQAEATRKEENDAARKQRIAELKMNAELDLAMKVAAMTPAERAAYRGSTAASKKFNAPSWYGKMDPSDPSKVVDVSGVLGGKATIGDINVANDLLNAAMQDPAATDPTTAYDYWNNFYFKVPKDARAIFRATGRPDSASAIYKQLFGSSAPTK